MLDKPLAPGVVFRFCKKYFFMFSLFCNLFAGKTNFRCGCMKGPKIKMLPISFACQLYLLQQNGVHATTQFLEKLTSATGFIRTKEEEDLFKANNNSCV